MNKTLFLSLFMVSSLQSMQLQQPDVAPTPVVYRDMPPSAHNAEVIININSRDNVNEPEPEAPSDRRMRIIVGAISATLSSLITAGVVLAIHFTNCK